jgi:hypothetical protein
MSTTVVTAYCDGRKRSMQSIRNLVSGNRYAPYFPQFFVFNISNLFGSQTKKKWRPHFTLIQNNSQTGYLWFSLRFSRHLWMYSVSSVWEWWIGRHCPALPRGDSGMQRSPLAFNNNNNNNNNKVFTNFPRVDESPPNSRRQKHDLKQTVKEDPQYWSDLWTSLFSGAFCSVLMYWYTFFTQGKNCNT